ncbi:aminopeptidase P family protein [Phormidium sp. CCY1219]|uniref:aminopeptidase P family protein n=1 Tax=Phormidium sp. CCY1219 TaxID=2886104 RepID=UPI002D1EBB64|nr:aminopeptidase P family protein [Phormidium sp. CCY1219]MEB3831677.1 aminopeptidase P family protein [Phormidium sp. CCY1219]
MQTQTSTASLDAVLRDRREKLARAIDFPAILWSGSPSSRNFPANVFRFRPSSHFLYFAWVPVENAAIRLAEGKLELFMDDPSPASTLWHGVTPKREEIALAIGADAAFPLWELASRARGAATIAVQDGKTLAAQSRVLDRPVSPAPDAANPDEALDLQLAKAIAQLRLTHDEPALKELRQAAACTVQVHLIGMKSTREAKTEAMVRGAMEGAILSQNFSVAYNSIVTVHGEVLHNERYHHRLHPGDLLLADVGAETATGWASDVTRTWPVSGQFSPTQRDIYDVVLAAHDACIEQVGPDVEYLEVHLHAARILAEGLVDLGILQGNPEDLVAMDAHALFFPHGVGHLLGLDVHDMEDLGDVAGYAAGRQRSDRFGLCYLRLHRRLQPGMLVTIEPGFYQVPAILQDPQRRSHYDAVVNWDKLAHFSDVRGIRIEDDVLVTPNGREVFTADIPTQADTIEQIVQSGS